MVLSLGEARSIFCLVWTFVKSGKGYQGVRYARHRRGIPIPAGWHYCYGVEILYKGQYTSVYVAGQLSPVFDDLQVV